MLPLDNNSLALASVLLSLAPTTTTTAQAVVLPSCILCGDGHYRGYTLPGEEGEGVAVHRGNKRLVAAISGPHNLLFPNHISRNIQST